MPCVARQTVPAAAVALVAFMCVQSAQALTSTDVSAGQAATQGNTAELLLGGLFCFPKYHAGEFAPSFLSCPEGYTVNRTSVNSIACTKKELVISQTCFRSTQCPNDAENILSEQVCMPKEVRSAMIGMLVVFKVQAKLPFMVVPALKTAITQAITLPITLPAKILESNFTRTQPPQLPRLNLTVPKSIKVPIVTVKFGGKTPRSSDDDLLRQIVAIAGAGNEAATDLLGGVDPNQLLWKAMLNMPIPEMLSVTPRINAWVSEHLQNLTNVNQITAEISSTFPDCLYRCCRKDIIVETSSSKPTPACSTGLKYNPVLNLCVGKSAGYAACPVDMTECQVPLGQPICVARNNPLALDNCKWLGAQHKTLPKLQCP